MKNQLLEAQALQHRFIGWLEAVEIRLRRHKDQEDDRTIRLRDYHQPVSLFLWLTVRGRKGRSRLKRDSASLHTAYSNRLCVAHWLQSTILLHALDELTGDVIDV